MNRRDFCKRALAFTSLLAIPTSLNKFFEKDYIEIGVVTSFTMTTKDGKVHNLGKATIYARKLKG